MSETPQKPESHSPKKFFRSFNASPFRHNHSPKSNAPFSAPSPDVPSQTRQIPPSAHSRSLSQEYHSTHSRKNLGQTNWKHLIPPIPSSSTPSSSRSLSRNRHTIAISPNGSHSIPDLLQPLTDPELEKLFVISRQPGASPFRLPANTTPGNTADNDYFLMANMSQNLAPYQKYPKSSLSTRAETSGSSLTSLMRSNIPSSESFQMQLSRQNSNNMAHLHSHNNLLQSSYPNHMRQSSSQRDLSLNGGNHTAPDRQLPPPLSSQKLQRAVSSTQGVELNFSSTSSLTHKDTNSQTLVSSDALYQQHLHQSSSSQGNLQPKRLMTKKRKTCNICRQIINGQFVRALNSAYHIECFKCFDCGTPCSAKFFPHEVKSETGQTEQVPLCEYDYFKRLDLLCFNCDNALRGPYITALGNKYHLEHFKCSACGKIFESDESYYEHENSIYCHFHYSNMFATKCEGCKSSIVKQFVELFKSGKVQQWHPECYMVFKFWNVCFTVDTVGLPDNVALSSQTEMSAKELSIVESKIESNVLNCWISLSGFEETSASCISEMLLAACTGKRQSGLQTTGKLILYLEVLFKALDFVQHLCKEFKTEGASVMESRSVLDEVYSADAFDRFQSLRKEPRNISGKLMSYLAILRKSSQISESGSLSAELLSVITGCAHYLKLLIRIGLNNALKLNKLRTDTKALDGFLQIIKLYEEIEQSSKLSAESQQQLLNSRLAVNYNATDLCLSCSKSIEKACVKFQNLRWHEKCFECSSCHRKPSLDFRTESFLCGPDDLILCTDCARSRSRAGLGYHSGFVKVSDLAQLVFLLKIAIFRSRSAIKKDSEGLLDLPKPTKEAMSHIQEEQSGTESETVYSNTLNEVTTLRKKRESRVLRNSVKKNARKSVIVEAPEAVSARTDSTPNELEDRVSFMRQGSASSSQSFITLAKDADQFDFRTNPIKIRDEGPTRLVSNSLDRTSDLLKNEKSLTLDDIPRIVAAEQAREQRPNAFKHHNSLYQKKNQTLKSISAMSNNGLPLEAPKTNFGSSDQNELKHKYFSELSKDEHTILRLIAIEALLDISKQHSREDLTSMIASKKQSTFWEKFRFGGGNDKNKHMNVFGVDLKEVTRKYGVDSSLGVGPSQLRIPIVVDDVIQTLRQKDMSVEGIFRLNGNIKNLRELTEQINATPLKSPTFSNYSAVQLAALMKKWLRELPNPLLTFNLYELWISSRKTSDPLLSKRILQLTCCMLPRSHRNLLEVLLYFFSWVASFADIDEETGSKMDTHNLATVIAPNILLSKASSGDPGENQSSDAHFLAIEVVNLLIELHEDLAVIPSDIWEFYEKCQFTKPETLTTKEINGKISKVAKDNAGFFTQFLKLDRQQGPSHQNTIRKGQAVVHENN